jgi:DNA primase
MEITEQVRQASNIVEIASQYTALRVRGRKHVGLCPFHAEKTPSFTVDSDKQLYHCFGCGVGGDVFSLVMEKENLNFPEALRFLAERYHVPIPEQRKLTPQALQLEEQLVKLNESALAFFRKNLQSSAEGKKALEYLKKRGISDDIIGEFKLGYAPNVWDSLASFFKTKGVEAHLLEKAGLVIPGKRAGEFYDRFRGRVIFPIFSLTGKVVGFGGRTLFDVEPKYLNSPDTPLYTKGQILYGLNSSKDALRQAGEAILVEGYTDYLSLYQAGIRNVAASLGTALTPVQLGLAMRFAPRVVLNYDGDSAGRTAAFRALPMCFERGLETRVLVLPDDLDPDSFLKKNGPDAYRKLLGTSLTGIQFFLAQSVRGQRMSVPEVKTRVLKGILDSIDRIPDAVLRGEYIRETAETLRIDESVIRRLSQPHPSETGKDSGGELFPAERRLLQMMVEKRELWPEILPACGDGDFAGLQSEPVFRIILDRFRSKKDLLIHELQKEIDPALARRVSEALLQRGETPSVEEAVDCLCALRKTVKTSELKKIQAELAQAERSGDNDRVAAILRRRQDLTREIMALP